MMDFQKKMTIFIPLPSLSRHWILSAGTCGRCISRHRNADVNGITLGKQISEELPAPPEIIYVTAFPEYSLDAWDIGAFGYILKPYDPKQIGAVLNRVLKYHAAAAESITSAASIEGKTGLAQKSWPYPSRCNS